MTKARTRDADATREAILKAAERIFATKGFAGTTLRGIAEKSGASGPLIVFHFGDKRGVYEAVKAAIVERYAGGAAMDNPPEGPFRVFLEHLLASMFRFYRGNPTMMRLANWGRLEGDVDPWPGEDEWHHLHRERIRLAQERGEIRDDLTPLNISIMISGAMHIWWEYHRHFMKHTEAGEKGECADDEYLRQCLAFVLRGLSKTEGNLETQTSYPACQPVNERKRR